jgi:hypothetical protein
MGQHDTIGPGLDQLDEPFVAGGGLDRQLKGGLLGEILPQSRFVVAGHFALFEHFSVFIYEANADSLLVEVDADKIHGMAPFVEIGKALQYFSNLPRVQGLPEPARPPLS